MADMKNITVAYYRDLLEKDPLLPQRGEPLVSSMNRIHDEHAFHDENTGASISAPCMCVACAPLEFFLF